MKASESNCSVTVLLIALIIAFFSIHAFAMIKEDLEKFVAFVCKDESYSDHK